MITTTADYAGSVYAVDVDGDGHMDILSASRDDDTIAWYKNDGTSGTPSFTEHVITTTADGARSLRIKSILEVPWVHCNGLYEMNICSYGSFIKVVTFMRAFCNLIVKSRESKVYKKQNSS